MPPTTDAARAAALAAALRALPVDVEDVEIRIDAVDVPSYPAEPRPTSLVRIGGRGETGWGEHVGWTLAAHEAFRERTREVVRSGPTTVADWSRSLRARLEEPYDRAALEAAAIDLALRQHGLDLASTIRVTPRATRYVVSFDASPDPAAPIERVLGRAPEIGAKVDVDPAWSDDAWLRLRETDRVVVLDWKRTGTTADHDRAATLFPTALHEDPGPPPCRGTEALAPRRSLDLPFAHARSLVPPWPVAANVKPARMGGVLEALEGVAFCAAQGIDVYLGGMFELGPGRRQLLALASLLAPDGPNDIAPIPRSTTPPDWPPRLAPPAGPGFGDFVG